MQENALPHFNKSKQTLSFKYGYLGPIPYVSNDTNLSFNQMTFDIKTSKESFDFIQFKRFKVIGIVRQSAFPIKKQG